MKNPPQMETPQMEKPPQMENPPRWRTPPDGEPPQMENPPRWRTPPDGEPPPRKQTPAYGLRAAGTHPTGMHTCRCKFHFINVQVVANLFSKRSYFHDFECVSFIDWWKCLCRQNVKRMSINVKIVVPKTDHTGRVQIRLLERCIGLQC